MMTNPLLSTKPYKGVRDFYPQNKRRQNYMFRIMRETARSFGYDEINASLLEPAELFDAKSGSELAQEQSYRFEDKGGREVMLRPEITPTTARMLAKRHKAMSFPVRWFSIPNLFRYERPQRGRLREFWQFNVDIFGVKTPLSTVEVIELMHTLLSNYGASPNDFVIYVNDRQIFFDFCADVLQVTDEKTLALSKLLDKRQKITKEVYNEELNTLLNENQVASVKRFTDADSPQVIADTFPQLSSKRIETVLKKLADRDIGNAVFSSELMRGLDYYTGPVFEIFDNHSENSRALFGGGRFDNLMSMFGEANIPAVGFGAGDVALSDFLDTHNLWPELSGSLDIGVILVDRDEHAQYGHKVARKLRSQGLNVAVDISGANVGTQIKQADKAGAENIVIIGDEEKDNRQVTIKTLATGQETTARFDELDSLWG